MEFHEKLQELRKREGLTQEELAQALFVSRTAISKWESGRGYPNIDSLKAIAKFYRVTVDELLSGEEMLTIAQEDKRQHESYFRDLVFGLLDMSVAMFLFLPFFGQRVGDSVQAVSLPKLTQVAPYLKTVYYVTVGVMVAFGVATLALQNVRGAFWMRHKNFLSLLLNAAAALVLIVSSQPYGAVLLFVYLIIKGVMVLQKR